MTGVAALLLALVAPSGMTLATPEGNGPVSLAVIVVPPGGDFLHFLQFPSSGRRPEGGSGTMFEHRRTFVDRVLAGPRVPRRVAIRQVYPDLAAMYRSPVRRLALLERTGSGYWFVQWQTRIERGRACLDAEAIARFRIAVPRRAPDRNGAICFNL